MTTAAHEARERVQYMSKEHRGFSRSNPPEGTDCAADAGENLVDNLTT
jgi:hypothetical protein